MGLLPMSADHYVYVIQEDKPSKKAPVKIGVAIDVEERWRGLQTGNPRLLKLVATFGPMTREGAYEMESAMHHRFRKQNLRGEWFSGRILRYLFPNMK